MILNNVFELEAVFIFQNQFLDVSGNNSFLSPLYCWNENFNTKKGWFGTSGTLLRVDKQYVSVEYICWTAHLQ